MTDIALTIVILAIFIVFALTMPDSLPSVTAAIIWFNVALYGFLLALQLGLADWLRRYLGDR